MTIRTDTDFWPALCALIPNLPRDNVREALIRMRSCEAVEILLVMYAADKADVPTTGQTTQQTFAIVPQALLDRYVNALISIRDETHKSALAHSIAAHALRVDEGHGEVPP